MGFKGYLIQDSINTKVEQEDIEFWLGSDTSIWGQRLWGQAGKLIRWPNGLESYGTENSSSVNQIHPESARSFELGVENEGGNLPFNYGISAFWRDEKNSIAYYFDPVGRYLVENYGQAQVKGIEYQLGASLNRWQFGLKGQWLDSNLIGENNSNRQRPYLYQQRFSPEVLFTVSEQLKIQVNYSFMDKGFYDKDNILPLPNYESLDVNLHLTFKAVDWTFYVNQLLNHQVPDISGNLPQGRTLGTRFAASF